MKILAFVFAFISLSAFGAQKVAVVKLLRGDVKKLTIGKTENLKLNDWVAEGDVVKTATKSFVKLIFLDKSHMNVGPGSEMKIEKFNGKEAGVIDIIKGQVRSQVTKDYLQIQDQDKSKLFIKTSNAVMGVRGTDFMVTTNGQNTATVLFEGSVVFNNLTERAPQSTEGLEEIVDRGVRIMPGEFSVVEVDRPQPTVPAILNLKQRESLESNKNFESGRAPSSDTKQTRSVVPEGLSGKEVTNNSTTLKTEVSQVMQELSVSAAAPALDPKAQGFVQGDTIRPANGSFLHLESGVVIPPAADSVFDPNTNTFIPSPGNGTVSNDGNFVPPKNVEITAEGKVLMTVPQIGGPPKVVEVERPAPVVSNSGMSLSQVAQVIQSHPNLNLSGTLNMNTVASAANPGGTNSSGVVIPTNSSAAPVASGGIDLTTAVIQRTNGRLNIDVIK
jgi:hypothetical protein